MTYIITANDSYHFLLKISILKKKGCYLFFRICVVQDKIKQKIILSPTVNLRINVSKIIEKLT